MAEERFIYGTDIPRIPVDPVTLQVLGGEFKSVAAGDGDDFIQNVIFIYYQRI